MLERIYEDLEPEARVAEMAATAIKREGINYHHKYSEEELVEKRKDLTDVVTELCDLEDEKKQFMEDNNASKKEREQVRNELVRKIRRGGETVFNACWKFADYDERKVGYYDAQGILVLERDMTPDEFQREMNFNAPAPAQEAETPAVASIPESTSQQPEDVDFEEVTDPDPDEE